MTFEERIMELRKEAEIERTRRIEHAISMSRYSSLINGLCEVKGKSNLSPYILGNALHSPSYISFHLALCIYDIIPEFVYAYTYAAPGIEKELYYDTPLGRFMYFPVSEKTFPIGLCIKHDLDATYLCATPEKAVCDMLTELPEMENPTDFEYLMYEDMRFDEESIDALNIEIVKQFSEVSDCKNVRYLLEYLEKIQSEENQN